MSKEEFLGHLRQGLSGLPQDDIEERVSFYSEIIDDRIEEGLSEEESVLAVGNVDEIVAQIVDDVPFAKIAKERIKTKRQLKTWEILLLVLGSPMWISLLIAIFAVIFSIYVVLWCAIISLWAVFVSLVGCAIGGILAGIVWVLNSEIITGLVMMSVGIVCMGLAIFMFCLCRIATRGTVLLTKKITLSIKKFALRKREV